MYGLIRPSPGNLVILVAIALATTLPFGNLKFEVSRYFGDQPLLQGKIHTLVFGIYMPSLFIYAFAMIFD